MDSYRIPAAVLAELTREKRAALKANRGLSDLLGFGCRVVADRIAKDPRRYLDYGPYWWALKDVLSRAGYRYGDDMDEGLASIYSGKDDTETLVAADLFRDQYLGSRAIGERDYQLGDDEGERYSLFDEDMEGLA